MKLTDIQVKNLKDAALAEIDLCDGWWISERPPLIAHVERLIAEARREAMELALSALDHREPSSEAWIEAKRAIRAAFEKKWGLK